jgi:multidrug efflux pump
MFAFVKTAINLNRSVLLLLMLILVSGTFAYLTIPKEAEPDVDIPIVSVSVRLEGISAQDAERLLTRPLEQELRSVTGLKEMRSTSMQSMSVIILEFVAGFDSEKALNDIRDKVDLAKSQLPPESDDPVIKEFNIALFPILVLTLSGEVPDEQLIFTARKLQKALEALPDVLEVQIGGDREEMIEILIDPLKLESYNLSQMEVVQLVRQNNQLIAAGNLEMDSGRYAITVPGVFETLDDILNVPIKRVGEAVIRFKDVAVGRRTFKDPTTFARNNGKPAISLEISKRLGANVIETIDTVKWVTEQAISQLPEGIRIDYSQDKSVYIRDMLKDLQNNVMIAILLVSIVLVATLGLRAAGLVGIAIPGSFLAGILALSIMGYTINIIVLFSLIMAVGMLVDGAIVVVELADRKMAENYPRREAYRIAAQRMAWPITASTATTLAAFAPLLIWPGLVGEFMKYLPITLIATLTASLFMALIFVPVVGSLIGKRAADSHFRSQAIDISESGDLHTIQGGTGWYIRILAQALKHPVKMILLTCSLLIAVYITYFQFGKGVEFFPEVEPENAFIQVIAQGDLSIFQRSQLVREVENRILPIPGLKSVYALAGVTLPGQEIRDDTIGTLQVEFDDWQVRRPAAEIIEEIRLQTASVPGVMVQVREQESGPPTGKAIQIELSADNADLLEPATQKIRDYLETLDDLVDINDSRPVPGIEWQIHVDRARASEFGMDVAAIGNAIQLVTGGINLGAYRPDDSDDEIDIRIRFPENSRHIDQLQSLRIPTSQGAIPVSHFTQRVAAQKVSKIEKTNAKRIMMIDADLTPGTLTQPKIEAISKWIESAKLDPGIAVRFKGEDEERKAASQFLLKAFFVAMFLITIILVTQFNSYYQAFLILTSVLFSTIGVLLGLLITAQPFGIVMCGIGVIALAGIVVNNNIVLIDTFNHLCRNGLDTYEAILRTGAQRLRPVMLTTVTTIFGLLPMVFGLNIDLIGRKITLGAPSSQWWSQLSTAIAGGLAFATVLTLVLTPCMLMLGKKCPASHPENTPE